MRNTPPLSIYEQVTSRIISALEGLDHIALITAVRSSS
jgi:hypothetical protein